MGKKGKIPNCFYSMISGENSLGDDNRMNSSALTAVSSGQIVNILPSFLCLCLGFSTSTSYFYIQKKYVTPETDE